MYKSSQVNFLSSQKVTVGNQNMKKITKLAVLVSGGGTNLENSINYFKNTPDVEVSVVISNKADAYAVTRA